MNTKTSNGTIPAGLSLYVFDYPPFHESDGTWCCGPNGECVTNPPQCHLESHEAARKFAEELGACRAVHVLSGEVVYEA
jgi:hypothetical protein